MRKLSQKNKYLILGLIIICLVFLFGWQFKASALEVGLSYGAQTGLGTTDIRVTIARIINVFFGLLGAAAVVIVLYGGFIWMTAQGEAEKIQKAKKILIGAVIGLVIALSAFAISSFILNQLIAATGAGGGGGGGGCTGTTCYCTGFGCGGGGCSNPIPGSLAPFICGLSPTSGARSTSVTITGGNFLTVGPNSKVYFNRSDHDYQATLCSNLSWTATSIVVDVPDNLPELGEYQIFVENNDGLRSSTNSLETNIFTLNNDTLGPGICTVNPDNGKEGNDVSLTGKRFGATQGSSNLIFAGNVNANFINASDWGDTQLQTKVPANAQTGEVFVNVPGKPKSNGVGFRVICSANSDCSTGCCYQTNVGKICADANYCKPGENEDCADKHLCADDGCQTGLFCDAADCKCHARGPGSPCDGDLNTTGCQASDNLCGPDLYCSSAVNCSCQYSPKIDTVDPINGAPGNYVTIFGRGFGPEPGTVVLTQGTTEIPADLPTGCGANDLWQDDQVIIQVPPAAAGDYGIKLTNRDNLTAEWSGTFTINDIVRPGLCGVTPSEGEFKTEVSLSGKNFGGLKAEALLGGTSFDNNTNWQWADNLITNLAVPNLQPALLQAQVKVGEIFSNPLDFKVKLSGIAPKIDYVDPAFGPKGQYVTIFGSNFGSQTGTVRFYQGEANQTDWQEADISFPQTCATQYWHNNYIVVKVPDTGTVTADSKIVVQTADGTFSNQIPFSRCNQDATTCPLRPGICRISPDQAPVGTGNITIYGENFGNYNANSSKVNFWDNKNVVPTNLSSYWTNNKIGTGATGPNQPILPLIVPTGATSGPVSVVDQTGSTSNKIQFSVSDCRGNEGICTGESTCCPQDGVCKSNVECFGELAPKCNYAWGFTTGTTPDITTPPQVIEEITCAENTQSPSPWKNSQANCLNAMLSARFTKEMNPTSFNFSGTNANLIVQKCSSSDLFDETACTSETLTISSISLSDQSISGQVIKNSLLLVQPQSNLTPGIWYNVTLKSGSSGLKSKYGVQLDGNFDNVPGGDYSWHFKVQDSAQSCALNSVAVQPSSATLKAISETQNYSSFAFAENCNILNGNEYDWHWYKKYSDATIEGDLQTLANYGFATISRNDLLPQIYENGLLQSQGNGKNDWQQVATPKKQGLVYVGAEVFPAPDSKNKKDDNNELVIDLNIPEISRIYPDNGLINQNVDAYVTVYGKNFGATPLNSKILFDQVAAPLADCVNAWSDTMIQVKVPKAMPITAGITPTYITPKIDAKNGMALFYDFQDQSNVVLQDRIGSNEGEIKGGQRVNDQMGPALSLNGTADYIKLPNSLNLAIGSLELWFKPQSVGRQTIFSASDGTAANNFSIDFDSSNKFYITINGQESAVANSPLKNNSWNHLVYAYDGSKINLYLNGFGLYSTAKNQGFLADVANKTNVLIGAKNEAGLKNYFKGLVSGFALYNNVLSQNDVLQNFGLSAGQLLLLNFEDSGAQISDSSANHFQGMSVVNSTLMTQITGKSGSAVSLNGTNIKITNDPALVFNNAITVEGWFNLDSATASTIYDANGIKLGILASCGTGNLCFRVTTQSGDKYAAIPLSGNFRPKEWNYFAGIFDGNQVTIYLNGQNVSYPASNDLNTKIIQTGDYNNACLGGCNSSFVGALDQVAVYNQALTPAEIGSRVGAKDGSHLIVQTVGGEATSAQTFKYSQNVYPFLCSLNPNYGTENSPILAQGANFGDSNKTTFNGQTYGVGSYINFENVWPPVLENSKISDWANQLINYLNPFSTAGSATINVSVTIDPYSEPYNDPDGEGVFVSCSPGQTEGCSQYADLNSNNVYDKATYEVENFQTKQVENLPSLESNSVPFNLEPVITSISPDNGPIRQWVTINGYNFGNEPGLVYFYNNQYAELAPCLTQTWTNNYIIAVVPDSAQSGDVYIETYAGVKSNGKPFSVNNKPLGAGLCAVYTLYNNQLSSIGTVGDKVYADGDRFGDEQGESQLLFSNNIPAEIGDWEYRNLQATIPSGSVSGDVIVTKKIESGRTCAGFHIGSFCPSGKYDILYSDIPSNSIPFNVTNNCGNLGVWAKRDLDFPLETWIRDSAGNKVPYTNINLGISANDGTYLYTMARVAANNFAQAPDSRTTIFKIGTGYNQTEAGFVYDKYQYDYQANNPTEFRVGPAPATWLYYGFFSMVATADGSLYGGVEVYDNGHWNIPKIKFNEVAKTYSLDFQPISEGINILNDADGLTKLGTPAQLKAIPTIRLTSNGNNIFALTFDLTGGNVGDRLGYTIQVFDLNWNLVKKFEVKNVPESSFPPGQEAQAIYYSARGAGGLAGFVADDRNLYIEGSNYNVYFQVIDWQRQEYTSWWNSQQNLMLTYIGSYDWVNKKFWFGTFGNDYYLHYWPINSNLPTAHNRIYRWSGCGFGNNPYACNDDTDCQACGANTSHCLNGVCTPYIANFSPNSGAIGSWVSVHGCYFGCNPGSVYFWGNETNSAGTLTGNVGFYKRALTLSDPECGNTWRCSLDGQDEVVAEVPDKNFLPNEPNADLEHDAITGPLKLIRSDGYEDTTEPTNFTVNTTVNPQICAAIPAYGNRQTTVRLHGENLGTAGAGNYVSFEPANGQVREPFSSTTSTWASGDPYIDFNNNNQYDSDLNAQDYTFQISNYVGSSVRADCPTSGWADKNICFEVPATAGGYGSPLMTALNWVSVTKDSLQSNNNNFSVTFGNCGNNNIDTDKGETCDGAKMPTMTNDDLIRICKELFPLAPNEDILTCASSCNNTCNLQFCIGNNCKSIIELCGNSQVDKYPSINYVEDCDGAALDGKSCQDKGFSSGTLACYTFGNAKQCKFDTAYCSNIATTKPPLKVVATVPFNSDDKFCRNGMFDIYFDSNVDTNSLTSGSGASLTKNIKVESCAEQTYSLNKGSLINIVANVFRKLFSFGRQATAQQICTPIPDEKISLKVLNFNDKSMVSVVPTDLLEPGRFYRVTISGGTGGVKNIQGGILTANSGEDYVFGFKTLGIAEDVQSGICNVEWIDVNVYRSSYTNSGVSLTNRKSELRSDDLFMCAGKDTCRLDLDFDQDLDTSGNQHIYEAIGKSSGGISLKASYKWSRTDVSDPQRALRIYNNNDDTDPDANIVKNDDGIIYATAAPIKEAIAKLVAEAQAQGSFTSPAQKEFLVYTLLCENPWPSVNEKFPISSIINAYNFQTYYCRDATTPGGQLLPVATYLLPDVNRLNTFTNTNFNLGDLTNWTKLFGNAYASQPVYTDMTLARIGIASKPEGSWWIGSQENYQGKSWQDPKVTTQGPYATGILSSPAFIIEGDQLKFLIGGTASPDASSMIDAEAPGTDNLPDVTAVTLEVRDPNDTSIPAKFYVRLVATGENTTTMREAAFNISSYIGKIGIIKIYDTREDGYINFDDLRQYLNGNLIPIRF